jgi:hypothetical protein
MGQEYSQRRGAEYAEKAKQPGATMLSNCELAREMERPENKKPAQAGAGRQFFSDSRIAEF